MDAEKTYIPLKSRIHPLVAGAAVALIIASAVGVAAITGLLPGSNAEKGDVQPMAAASGSSAPAAQPAASQRSAAPAAPKPVKVASAPTSSAPAKPRCVDCGTVVDVKEVEVKGEGSGGGALAGGVIGGVIGHEVVGGRNQGVATAIGAVGGAIAGHEIEKRAKTHKRYDVAIRMEDGSTRTVHFKEAPTWRSGDRVRVSGDVIMAQK
ncbi:MAG: glycine zipper 2TM domain-containing protein [Betaproteobacteria bacterium]